MSLFLETLSCATASIETLPVTARNRQRAIAVLPQLLEPSSGHADEPAYRPYSRLTPTGFPVEFAFGNPSDELRYTCEVGSPALPAAQRLELAARRLNAVGAEWSPSTIDRCRELQAGSSRLRYGAWASVRHRSNGDRFKMYVEVPQNRHDIAFDHLGVGETVRGQILERGARLIMMGVHPNGTGSEYYFGVNGFRYSEISDVMGWFDSGPSSTPTIEAFETVCGRFLNRTKPNRQGGFSVKRDADGAWVVTVFMLADDLFASGAATRRALLDSATALGSDLSSYEVFSESAAQEHHDNRHCMIALTALADDHIDVRVGLSPEPPVASGCRPCG